MTKRPSPDPRRGFGKAALVALALVLGAELLVRAVSPYLPEPLEWYNHWAQTKAAEMEAIGQGSQSPDVVFVGSSAVISSLDPITFGDSNSCDLTAYNAAIVGATARGLDHWTREVVVPRLRPKIVLVGLVSRDMKDGAQFFARYLASPAIREDFSGKIDSYLSDWSLLFRYRSILRRPEQWKAVLDRIVRGVDYVDRWNDAVLGWYAYPPDREYELGEFGAREAEFRLGSQEVRALEELVRTLTHQGIRVAIAELPVSEDYPRLIHPDDGLGYEEYRTTMRELGRRAGVSVIDLTSFSDVGLFGDPAHMKEGGARLVTEQLAAEISRLFCSEIAVGR